MRFYDHYAKEIDICPQGKYRYIHIYIHQTAKVLLHQLSLRMPNAKQMSCPKRFWPNTGYFFKLRF